MADSHDSETLSDFDDARVDFAKEKVMGLPFRDCICDGSSV